MYDASDKYAVVLANKWRHHNTRVTALAWGPSDKLASTSNDETIFVWTLETHHAVGAQVRPQGRRARPGVEGWNSCPRA